MINKKELNGDGIGYVEQYNFSKANMSEENRIDCVTSVASICVGNKEAKNKLNLYNRLATESKGIPSSSYEFVPVLIPFTIILNKDNPYGDYPLTLESHCLKFGEIIEEDDQKYLLTNLRALLNDVGDQANQFYNTEEECNIIAKHFKVFKCKIDLSTRSQLVRHRTANFQELSRRYVSGKKQPFEFYISPELQDIYPFNREDLKPLEIEEIYEQQIKYYDQAIEQGVKPQEARRILPQAAYTEIWTAYQPGALDNFLQLRTKANSQDEIRELANAMIELIKKDNN